MWTRLRPASVFRDVRPVMLQLFLGARFGVKVPTMLLEAASYGVQALLRHGSWIMAFVLEGGILGYFAMQPHSTRHFALFGM